MHRVSAHRQALESVNKRTAVLGRGFVAKAVPRLLHVLAVLPLPAARGGDRQRSARNDIMPVFGA